MVCETRGGVGGVDEKESDNLHEHPNYTKCWEIMCVLVFVFVCVGELFCWMENIEKRQI